MGYTPSEKPREAIAETSVSIALSAIGGPASRSAANAARNTLNRGCNGPLRRLPQTMRRTVGISCFTGDTEVITKNGIKLIQDIQAGDYVQCRNEDTLLNELCVVEKVHKNQNREILELVIKDMHNMAEIFRTTPNHRFWLKNVGWTEAVDLMPGDILLDLNGNELEVIDAIFSDETEMTYNLDVKNHHSYFVGELAVWVHNGGPKNCPVKRRALNLNQASSLLGRKVRRWSEVTVGELRNLRNTGKITQGQFSKTLRGSSRSARNAYIKLMESTFGKDNIMVRIGDQTRWVPRSLAKKGKKFHMGHQGVPHKDGIELAPGGQSVTTYRKNSWDSAILESAEINSGKGAGLTELDVSQ